MSLPGLREAVPLAPMTTWRVGGAARYLLEPASVDEVRAGVAWAGEQGLPWIVIGKGSNLLVADAGYDGLVIRMTDRLGTCELVGDRLQASAGCSNHILVRTGAEADRGGLEFMTTIPGTVGGAIFMNAGAHGASVMDVLADATLLLPDGSVVTEDVSALGYRYRHSNLEERGAIALAGTFKTVSRPKVEVQKEVSELAKWRRERQPQALSAGSVFTNPGPKSAGQLIEETGLKGLTIGRAQVSPIHANFFVNMGGATAQDLIDLIGTVRDRVHAKHGVWLHPEVRTIGCEVPQETRVERTPGLA
jgi:UDP-N-acetylmuramate dehydrogenase